MVVISKIDYTSLFDSNKVDYCLTLTNYNTKNHNMFISILYNYFGNSNKFILKYIILNKKLIYLCIVIKINNIINVCR